MVTEWPFLSRRLALSEFVGGEMSQEAELEFWEDSSSDLDAVAGMPTEPEPEIAKASHCEEELSVSTWVQRLKEEVLGEMAEFARPVHIQTVCSGTGSPVHALKAPPPPTISTETFVLGQWGEQRRVNCYMSCSWVTRGV